MENLLYKRLNMTKKIIIFFAVLLFANSVSAGWLATHSYRKKFAIDSTNVNSTLSNFQFLVTFVDDSIGSHARSDGYDIAFTLVDGETTLYYDRVAFAIATGTATGWFIVNVPSIVHTDSTWIYLYYGDPDSGDLEDKDNTYPSSYKGVWHLEETTGDYLDASGTGNNSATVSLAARNATAKIGNNAADFSGANNKIGWGNILDVTTGDFTISLWADIATADLGAFFIGRKESLAFNENEGYSLGQTNVSTGQFLATTSDGNDEVDIKSGQPTLAYHHIVFTWDGSAGLGRLYDNGIELDNQTNASVGSITNTENFEAGESGSGGNEYDGILDEIRFLDTIITADWIKFEFENTNQGDHELVWHAQETPPAVTTLTRRRII